MDQSIASSAGITRPGKQPGRSLKSIFSGLWSSMTARKLKITSDGWHSSNLLSSDISKTLDIDQICTQLNLENRADYDGRNDQPPSTEEAVSGTQREIVAYFKELRRKAHHQIAVLAENLRELGEEIDVLGANGSLLDIPSRCENEVIRLIAESQSQLNYLGEREAKQRQVYEALHEKNKLNQVADRPISPLFHWVFIAFLIGVGAFAIARISVSGSSSANLIPPSWAILISLIVVLVSMVIARAVSRLADLVGQLAGWLGGAIGIALIGMMASLAAHYIAAVTTNPGSAVRSIVDSALADPIAIATSVTDWKIFGIIITAGLMAFMVGYRPDSSHEGHGDIPSTIYRTRNKRDRLTKRLRIQINDFIDVAEIEATELSKPLKLKVRQYSRLVDESKRLPASLSDYDVALEDGCNILLDRYRAANKNARQSEAPMSFSEHICFRPEPEENTSIFGNEASRLEELHQGIVELDNEAAQVRQKLRDLNSRAISALDDTSASV